MNKSKVWEWRDQLKDKGLTKSDIVDLTYAIDQDLLRIEKLIINLESKLIFKR